MFVDQDHEVWLIDFFKTGWGPILRDFGEVESVIKFELVRTHNLAALFELEQALLTPAFFDDPIPFTNRFGIPELNKACAVLAGLRRMAQNVYESPDIYEYYVGLFFYALKMITWDGISSGDRDRFDFRQRHALFSAAMLAYRLQHWNDWSGWPQPLRPPASIP
jgi:hypothetical protein